ncbi:MAG: aldo/keto reductase [Lachnospiraceae bacterium]|nr:aldo/keto reductase [Lachnospiraceae bacterium]
MYYNNFQEKKLSNLGFGAMRLPVIDGDSTNIDKELTAKMIAYAIDNGVNYFDTAWPYHGGNSELVVGELLKNYPRDSFNVATKFPSFSPENFQKKEEIFAKQLEKLQVEYFDFYLLHNVNDGNLGNFLNPEYGVVEYMVEQKKAGKIKHLGFSCHASNKNFLKFLDAYGDVMEFCQIQLNWVDWDFQDAKVKVEELQKRNIPIWVMEPIRGGKLATIPEDLMEKLNAYRPGLNAPEWCFRFLQAIPGVTVILSGMSNFEQVEDNVRIFNTNEPVSDEERDLLFAVAKDYLGRTSLPCTACRYCTGNCPQSIDIPTVIEYYNESAFIGSPSFQMISYINSLPEGMKPQDCLGCQACEGACPQNIEIAAMMEKIQDMMAKK